MAKVYKLKELPENTIITKGLISIDYYDSYKVIGRTEDSIEKITDKILTLPDWINCALRIRYYLIVKPFGLKTGRFENTVTGSESKKQPVPIIEKNKNEIVMGADDSHLYYRLSVMKKKVEQGSEIYLNTIVRFNNIWGRIYFLPVRLGHKLVVRSILKKLY